ncbi:hypothetical protein Taro_055558, partial [Colocasia esculenta]|nr:hypothetical protein [Colocasia esculenta]
LGQALLGQGRLLWQFSRQFGILEVFSAHSHREDVTWSGGDTVSWMVFTFFAKCGTVEVYVIILDTLTPEFELYVRLRERRQRAATCVELVLRLVTCSELVVGVAGLRVRGYETKSGSLVVVLPVEVCPGVGTVVVVVSERRLTGCGLIRVCGTVEVCVIFLDTLTPEFEVYVWLRERQPRATTCVELVLRLVTCSVLLVRGTDSSRRTGPQLVLLPVPQFRELGPESLKVPGMGLQCVRLQVAVVFVSLHS